MAAASSNCCWGSVAPAHVMPKMSAAVLWRGMEVKKSESCETRKMRVTAALMNLSEDISDTLLHS